MNNYVLAKLQRAGLMLKPYTVANREQIYSTAKKNIKVCITKDLVVDVVDFSDVPRIVDGGFYINPFNPQIAVDRIMKTLEVA